MRVIKTKKSLRRYITEQKPQGKTIGFVPTMGALHAGHLSLIHAAKKTCDIVVVSIFVNPTQFGPDEDFSLYPRVFNADKKKCNELGVDVLFHPSVEEIYSSSHAVSIDVGEFSDILCGKYRPGHFQGVATVVLKLFNIVTPDIAFFGQKDAQQVCVIEKLVNDLDLPIKIKACPIVREQDGLAMSSRNRYLSKHERVWAIALYRALHEAQSMIKSHNISVNIIKKKINRLFLQYPNVKVEYFEIVDPNTLAIIKGTVKGKVLILGAISIGKTRLIDNVYVKKQG